MSGIGFLVGYILKIIFSFIDSIICNIITGTYQLFSSLSQLVLYSDNIVKTIGQRIGLFLGVFMLFRIAISLINYMISPDKMNDNSQGGAKLITNIIVSVVLLATVNIIFEYAYKVQAVILNSQIIEKIFFGQHSKTDMDIGYYLYSGFFTPNNDVLGDACDRMWDVTYDLRTPISGQDKSCYDKLVELDLDAQTIQNSRNDLQMSYTLGSFSLVLAQNNGKYVFNYIPVVSTVAGVIVLLVLISFSMDLATRAVKLLFLQLVAPIPIIFNMDPGKGKEKFQKWYKECFTTYLSVFLRLLAIDFAIFMVVLIKGNFADVFQGSFLLNTFIIVGCLMFARQVPKLLEDIFGIKTDGLAINPLRKFREQSLFGNHLTALAGAGLAGGAVFGANVINGVRNNASETGMNAVRGLFTSLRSGVAGAGSALVRGTYGSLRGQSFGQVYSGSYKGAITARNNRASRQRLNISGFDVMGHSINKALGIYTTAEVQDDQISTYDSFVSSAESVVSISESEVQKYANKIKINSGIGSIGVTTDSYVTSLGFTTLGQLREAMSDTTHYTAEQRARLNAEYERLKGDAEERYRALAEKGAVGLNASQEFGFIDAKDANAQTAQAHIRNVGEIFERISDDDVFTRNLINSVNGSNIKKASKYVKSESATIKNSDAYRRAHKIQDQARREGK